MDFSLLANFSRVLFFIPQTLNWIPIRLWHKSNIFSTCLDMKLQMLFGRMLNLNWIPPKDLMQIRYVFSLPLIWNCRCPVEDPQGFEANLISFCHALYLKLQMLLGCTLNLNWRSQRIWQKSDTFLPCPWYGFVDAFLSYIQPKFDTPKDLTQIRYLFAMPIIHWCLEWYWYPFKLQQSWAWQNLKVYWKTKTGKNFFENLPTSMEVTC